MEVLPTVSGLAIKQTDPSVPRLLRIQSVPVFWFRRDGDRELTLRFISKEQQQEQCNLIHGGRRPDYGAS
jgi:hypothetical protein